METIISILIGIAKFLGKNVATIIATCALVLSIYELRHKMKHDKLAVQPLLDTKTELFPDKVKIYIENIGLGHARILEYKIFYDGEETKRIRPIVESLEKDKKFPTSNITFQNFELPKLLQTNEEIILVIVTPKNTPIFTPNDLENIDIFRKKILVEILYESIFNVKTKDTLNFNIDAN